MTTRRTHSQCFFDCLLLISTFGISLLVPTSAPAVTHEWTRQLGTTTTESARWGVSADGLGNVYISGGTGGSLGGPNVGGQDAFVAKYDAAGNLLWTRQLGTTSSDASWDASADGLGNVYISGITSGSLWGPNPGENTHAFVAKYDDAGSLLWTRQLGPTSNHASSSGVSADGLGNVYMSGNTSGNLAGPSAGGPNDTFLAKYDDAGSLLWTRQLGSTGSEINVLTSADGLGNIYIAGRTDGSLGGPHAGSFDAFVAKYNADGSFQWSRQLGTLEGDNAFGVSADGLGNVYFTGYTTGNLGGPSAGNGDAYVAKYDAAGNRLWVRQLGTPKTDYSWDISADALGNVYVAGFTGDSISGLNADAYVAKYDAAGNHQWTRDLGTADRDDSTGVSADALGNVFIVGNTTGSLGGPNAGGADVFVAKFVDSLPGDFNADGTVDAADYVVWRNGLGTTYAQADYNAWRANFGNTAATAPGSAGSLNPSVPEPISAVLLAVGLLSLLAVHRTT